MAQYDHLATIPQNWPRSAVRVEPSNESPTVKWIYYDKDGRRLCSAKTAHWTPEKPKYCGTWNITENKRCKLHGGKSLKGELAPAFKTGKYSSVLPTRLVATYEETLDSPELMSLRSEIALTNTRIAELLQRANNEEAGVLHDEVFSAWDSFLSAKRSEDAQRTTEAFFKMNQAVKACRSDANIWREIDKLTESLRRLVLAEAKLGLLIGASVPIEKVNVMIGYILAMVNHRVSDQDEKWSLMDDILKLTGRGGMGGNVPTSSGGRALNPASFEEDDE